MTSKELFSRFELLEANLRQNQYLLDAISVMSNRQNEITSLHSRVLLFSDAGQIYNAVVDTKNKLKDIIVEIKKLSPKKIFAETNAVVQAITKVESAFDSHTTRKFELLKKEVEGFGEAYEKFISNQQLGEVAQLLSVAQRVDAAVSSSIEFVLITLKNLCSEPQLDETSTSEQRLEVYLSAKIDFVFFLEKTSALEQIYEEFCHLLNVSVKQEPLKIVKIESGSLWVWLNGNPKAVAAVKSVIEKAAHYFYRNYTDEGKILTIPKKVETLESILHLSDELKKRDISTDELDEHIKKASNAIGNSLEKLLAGEEQIELNGEVIALTPRGQQNLIANRQVKLIEEKAPE
jgi:hypothetical protein